VRFACRIVCLAFALATLKLVRFCGVALSVNVRSVRFLLVIAVRQESSNQGLRVRDGPDLALGIVSEATPTSSVVKDSTGSSPATNASLVRRW